MVRDHGPLRIQYNEYGDLWRCLIRISGHPQFLWTPDSLPIRQLVEEASLAGNVQIAAYAFQAYQGMLCPYTNPEFSKFDLMGGRNDCLFDNTGRPGDTLNRERIEEVGSMGMPILTEGERPNFWLFNEGAMVFGAIYMLTWELSGLPLATVSMSSISSTNATDRLCAALAVRDYINTKCKCVIQQWRDRELHQRINMSHLCYVCGLRATVDDGILYTPEDVRPWCRNPEVLKLASEQDSNSASDQINH